MSAKPQNATGPGSELPLELIDKIVESNWDEKDSLLASSCVSKLWRVASLRYLFSMADFSYHEDFTRWRDIGYRLPQVPLFVKEVVFEPDGRFGPGRRFEVKPTHSKEEALRNEISWRNRVNLLEEPKSLSNPSDIRLPDMPQAHKLVWKTSLIPISCTPETRQFLSTFCSLKEVEFEGRFATASDAKEFLELLPQIEILNIEGIDIEEAGSSRGAETMASRPTETDASELEVQLRVCQCRGRRLLRREKTFASFTRTAAHRCNRWQGSLEIALGDKQGGTNMKKKDMGSIKLFRAPASNLPTFT